MIVELQAPAESSSLFWKKNVDEEIDTKLFFQWNEHSSDQESIPSTTLICQNLSSSFP